MSRTKPTHAEAGQVRMFHCTRCGARQGEWCLANNDRWAKFLHLFRVYAWREWCEIVEYEAPAIEAERDAALARLAAVKADLAEAKRLIRAVEMVRCWTNEDGKRFVFADDVFAALAVPAATPEREGV